MRGSEPEPTLACRITVSIPDILVRSCLISTSFTHFEHSGDVQTLAIMACILSSSPCSPPFSNLTDTDATKDPIQHISRRSLPDTIYSSSEDGASRLARNGDSEILPYTYSKNSSLNTNYTNPSTANASSSISSGATPPIHRPPNAGPDFRPMHTAALSTSPENYRSLPRASSALSALTASLPRRFQFNSSVTPSPPDGLPLKRPSPTSSSVEHTQSSLTGSVSSWIHRGSFVPEAPKSRDSSDVEEAKAPTFDEPEPSAISCKLRNQDQFYGCGSRSLPLLDPHQEWKYRSWRQAYACCLEVWDMPHERDELLNYDLDVQV